MNMEKLQQKIAIIAMSAKPPTAGHFALIRIAAKECDSVELFVSLNDRARPGEITIFGKDMDELWKSHIEPSLPKNVNVTYVTKETPVGKVYQFLGNKNENGSDDTYVIYSDPHDIQKSFSDGQLEKYLQDMYKRGKIVLEPVSRSETVDISGTKMRKFLANGDKEKFIENLPDIIQDRGEQIWNQLILSATLATSKHLSSKKKSRFKV